MTTPILQRVTGDLPTTAGLPDGEFFFCVASTFRCLSRNLDVRNVNKEDFEVEILLPQAFLVTVKDGEILEHLTKVLCFCCETELAELGFPFGHLAAVFPDGTLFPCAVLLLCPTCLHRHGGPFALRALSRLTADFLDCNQEPCRDAFVAFRWELLRVARQQAVELLPQLENAAPSTHGQVLLAAAVKAANSLMPHATQGRAIATLLDPFLFDPHYQRYLVHTDTGSKISKEGIEDIAGDPKCGLFCHHCWPSRLQNIVLINKVVCTSCLLAGDGCAVVHRGNQCQMCARPDLRRPEASTGPGVHHTHTAARDAPYPDPAQPRDGENHAPFLTRFLLAVVVAPIALRFTGFPRPSFRQEVLLMHLFGGGDLRLSPSFDAVLLFGLFAMGFEFDPFRHSAGGDRASRSPQVEAWRLLMRILELINTGARHIYVFRINVPRGTQARDVDLATFRRLATAIVSTVDHANAEAAAEAAGQPLPPVRHPTVHIFYFDYGGNIHVRTIRELLTGLDPDSIHQTDTPAARFCKTFQNYEGDAVVANGFHWVIHEVPPGSLDKLGALVLPLDVDAPGGGGAAGVDAGADAGADHGAAGAGAGAGAGAP